jgi:anaphase-promoting complex subunit 2
MWVMHPLPLSPLRRYVGAQIELVALIDGRRWHGCGGGASAPASLPETPRCTEVTTLLQACVLAQAPEALTFAQWLTICWQRSFADIVQGGGEEEEEEEEGGAWADEDDGEDSSMADAADGMAVDDDAAAIAASEPFRQCCEALHRLGWLPLVEPTVSSMLHRRLHAALLRRCAKTFDERLLHRVLSWLRRGVTRWLRAILMPSDAADTPPSALLQQWLARLRFFLMQSLATLRISELFDIIVDYPDSLPALGDLKECLLHTHQHADAVASLAEAIETRLLKPGADTAGIIQVYVSAIKALHQLDPTGVTLEAVSEPVRNYLKARPDTIRQIVTSLTDPETSEILEPSATAQGDAELLPDEGGAEGEQCDLDELKGDEAAMLQWTPDPVQADPSRSLARRTNDVLSILVNIYGSKALFVTEFRSMLADKLLTASDYETDREVRNLELLKKRFGESALSSCEVMLKDIAESRRVTRSIHYHFNDEACKVLEATIVSRLCWPTLVTENFNLPESMAHEMARFEKQFMHHKAPRKLVWKPSLGCVTLDVAFEDKTVRGVKCSPMHATILHAFGEQPKWTLSALSAHLKIEPDTLKRRIILWINRGFILEAGKTADGELSYEAPTHLGSGRKRMQQVGDDDDGSSGGGAAEAQLEAEMRVYEQYVIGMLTNLESLPLGRIHNMLRMFVPAQGADKGYDRSETELQRFLNSLVEDGKLENSAGQYKIKR